MEEIAARQSASIFGERNIRTITWNAVVFLGSYFLSRVLRDVYVLLLPLVEH